ncbi:MAG: DUF1571 domain-containing protein [Bacteroidetes bacterium]|nr:DUF1571 domain-containing protein [Bacteroidota bacterium]
MNFFATATLPVFFMFYFASKSAFSQQNSSPAELNRQMLSAIETVNALTFTLKMWERFGTKTIYSVSEIRMMLSPFKVYIRNTEGNNIGVEVLWVAGENGGDALVNPAGFPYLNLDIDPEGSLVRRNVHHTLFDLGFDYFGKIIRTAAAKLGNEYYDNLFIIGDTVFGGRKCAILEFDYTGFKYISYRTGRDETLRSVSEKFLLNDYRLMELNPNIDGFNIIEEGKAITIPNLYCKKMIMFVDRENFLPVVQIIYDDAGMYEKYEFHELKINVSFGSREFTEDFEEYGF